MDVAGDVDLKAGNIRPAQLASVAETPPGLRYVSDRGPGITRRRSGKGFVYRDAEDGRVHDRATLERIRSLVIPPAWVEVWISPDPCGHIQATGRDARGRKQYRYHPRGRRQVRGEAKYGHMLVFGRALPRLRRRVAEDLSRPGLNTPIAKPSARIGVDGGSAPAQDRPRTLGHGASTAAYARRSSVAGNWMRPLRRRRRRWP